MLERRTRWSRVSWLYEIRRQRSALPFLFLPLSQPDTRSAAVLIDELDAGGIRTLFSLARPQSTHARAF